MSALPPLCRCLQELVKLSISVALNVAAPKVIIPVSSSSDKGFLLLDMGKHALPPTSAMLCHPPLWLVESREGFPCIMLGARCLMAESVAMGAAIVVRVGAAREVSGG